MTMRPPVTVAPYPPRNPGAVRRFRCSWTGVVSKTISVETAADGLYHVWSRYRDDFRRGQITVTPLEVDGVPGARLARLEFPVTIERVIDAPNAAEALRSFMFDDRLPQDPSHYSLTIVPVAEEPEALVPQAAE
jgi:hypothetical protein